MAREDQQGRVRLGRRRAVGGEGLVSGAGLHVAFGRGGRAGAEEVGAGVVLVSAGGAGVGWGDGGDGGVRGYVVSDEELSQFLSVI